MAFRTDTAKIRRWREARRWSQEHLAELAGVSLRTLQRVETGQQASDETLKALANAFQVDAMALSVDPEVEATRRVERRSDQTRRALRLSFWIGLGAYVLGMAVFAAINIGLGAWVMKWAMLWWTVGVIAHAFTVVLVELVTRYEAER